MTDTEQFEELPPPLALLRDTPTGAVYGLTTKNILLKGIAASLEAGVKAAEWNRDRSALSIRLQSGPRTTFTADGNKLVTECTCRDWDPIRQCSHVVTCWALLKKVVSPDSFSAFSFPSRLLRDVEILLGMEEEEESTEQEEQRPPHTLHENLEQAKAIRKRAIAAGRAKAGTEKAVIRLVLELRDGELTGSIRRGSEYVSPYGYTGVPADLRRFLADHFFFKPSIGYLRDFTSLKGGYPIVLRRRNGREIPLEFRNDEPLRAGITFSMEGGRVRILRCLADGSPLPSHSIQAGECLIDVSAGTIHPVVGREPWHVWSSVLEGLENLSYCSGTDFEWEGEFLVTSIGNFNALSLRLSALLLKNLGEAVRFIVNGEKVTPFADRATSCQVYLDGLDRERIALTPRGEAAGEPFPFYSETFRLFLPRFRSYLDQPLRARKRVTAMIETGFAMLDAASASARAQALRTGLSGPDFSKRSVKSDARRIVTDFVRSCDHEMRIILATPEGWRTGLEDRRTQARLVRLLYRLFGLDAFTDGAYPCAMEIDRGVFLSRLGELRSILESEGFGLLLRGEPLSVGSWEFSVGAVPDGIDWFELRPEIRCNGELLELEEIRRLIDEGVLRQGGSLYLLADEQRRILELLTGEGGLRRKRKKAEIVRIPRLQILDWLELRAHGVKLRLPEEEEKLLAGLTRLEKIPEQPLPEGLRANLRHYQKEGFDWLAFLHGHRFGACLADDMGLGKTVQTITFLAWLAEAESPSREHERLPHLVVVPPSLLFNWESEIARFYPGFRVLTYAGTKRRVDFSEADIVLTSYGILLRDAEILAAIPFHVAVFDEAQQIKNIKAATTGAARRINARFKLALTGTPMENHLGEYFSIMDLCVPGLLGGYDEFLRRVDIRGFGGVDTLVRRTRPFILRRSKQMIADELPPRMEADLYLEMNQKQKALYQRTVEEVRGTVDQAFRDKAPGQARMIALTAILRLRQICLCPSLLNPEAKAESPKLECLTEQLTELREEGHSTLVFSQFTSYLDIVEHGLASHKIPYLRLDGSTPVAKRRELVNRFQKSAEPLVFLISLKAGGKGLNLTRATYVYHLDPWWNPAVENQASDRAHRIGQTAKVTVTRLLMRHTVEEKMMALKERKLKLYKALLDDASGGGGAALTKEDFDFLLGV